MASQKYWINSPKYLEDITTAIHSCIRAYGAAVPSFCIYLAIYICDNGVKSPPVPLKARKALLSGEFRMLLQTFSAFV